MKLLVPPNPVHPWCKEKQTIVGFTFRRTPIKLKSTVKKTQNILQELSEIIPGLQQVLDSEKGYVFNFFWLILMLSCFVICLYQISNRFFYFLSEPIASRVTMVRNTSVKFPMMTICPYHRFIELFYYQNQIAQKYNISVCNVDPLETLEILNISSIWDKMNIDGEIGTVGVLSNSMFSDWVIPPIKNKTTTTVFGTCTTFLEEELVLYRGLNYVLSVGLVDNSINPCIKHYIPAVYIIHTNEDITYKLSTLFEPIIPNYRITYGISAKMFKRLNRTNAPCNTELIVNQCEKKCIEDFLKRKIACRLPFMSFDDHPLCDNSTSAKFTFEQVFKITTSFIYSKNCACSKICDHLLIMKNLERSFLYFKSTVEMFFDDDIIDTVEEYYSYSFITFICDVGGNLGLFLGLCVPTLLSILQSVLILIFKKIIH